MRFERQLQKMTYITNALCIMLNLHFVNNKDIPKTVCMNGVVLLFVSLIDVIAFMEANESVGMIMIV